MFRRLFPSPSNTSIETIPKIIGMIHVAALPATPGYKSSVWKGFDSGMQKILDQAKKETQIFAEFEGMNQGFSPLLSYDLVY